MKKLFAFILLLSNMNTLMLLPQVPENDMYDNGNQVDDITSVTEYVMVHLGIDHHADDENDDQGQNFHIVKIFEYCFQPVLNEIKTTPFITKPAFGVYKKGKTSDVCFDIILPPPKT